MDQKTTYVLSYSTGQYDNYCVKIFAVITDHDKANALCDKFNEIAKHYKDEFNAFAFMQEQERLLWNLENGEIPSAHHERLKKNSNPKWNSISDKEWQLFVAKHKESSVIARNKASKMIQERNQVLENCAKSFWDKVRVKMSDNLKDCVNLYPCRETEINPYFSVEQVPICE